MLGIVNFIGLMVKQKEKALKYPKDLKEADIRTIVTGYDFLPTNFKNEEIESIFDSIEEQFEERGLEKLSGFEHFG